jgi:hypothetical protein
MQTERTHEVSPEDLYRKGGCHPVWSSALVAWSPDFRHNKKYYGEIHIFPGSRISGKLVETTEGTRYSMFQQFQKEVAEKRLKLVKLKKDAGDKGKQASAGLWYPIHGRQARQGLGRQ